MPITVRPVSPDELLAWFQQLSATFFVWPSDPEASTKSPWVAKDPERRLAAFEDDRIVGTYRTFPTELTLPGGQRVQASGVSAVTTRPTHRRRGILTRMIEADIAAGVERGDVASLLYAAEWPIYGRFGYGPATWQARWTLRTRAATFATPPNGTVEVVTGAEARDVVPDIQRRFAALHSGEIARPEHYWDVDLGLLEPPGRPRWKGSIAIHSDASGTPDAYVRYSGEERWEEGIPDNIARIDELLGVSLDAEVELWRYLAALDLVSEVRASGRRIDEPFVWHLVDARAAQLVRTADGLWLRPYDVPRLLEGRTYDRETTVVLEVEDRLGEAAGPATGRYRLEATPDGAACRPTSDAADVTLTVAALGAAILGGTRLVDATRAGRAAEHRVGALTALDRLLRTDEPPWCSTFF